MVPFDSRYFQNSCTWPPKSYYNERFHLRIFAPAADLFILISHRFFALTNTHLATFDYRYWGLHLNYRSSAQVLNQYGFHFKYGQPARASPNSPSLFIDLPASYSNWWSGLGSPAQNCRHKILLCGHCDKLMINGADVRINYFARSNIP